MIVVLDTNILVSGLNYPGNERRILDYARNGLFELTLSTHILDELASVLARTFNWTGTEISENDSDLRAIGRLIDPPPLPSSPTGHAPDDQILACAAAANADFLVTGDRRHLLPLRTFNSTRIITATDFLNELEQADI